MQLYAYSCGLSPLTLVLDTDIYYLRELYKACFSPFIRVKMAIFVACVRDTKHLSTVSALVSLGTDSDPCLRAFCPSDPYLSALYETQLLRHSVCVKA